MGIAFAPPMNAFQGLLPGVPGAPAPSPLEDRLPVSTISPPKIRKEFPETWIWDNIDEDG